MKRLTISASMVLYRPDLDVLRKSLNALRISAQLAGQYYPLDLTLTLVDNSSDAAVHSGICDFLESSRSGFPDGALRLVKAPGNIGYGQGNNLVIAQARSDYHIVINPDLFVNENALLEAVRFMEAHPQTGLLSPAVFGEEGERHFLCKRHPTLLVMFLRSAAPHWLRARFASVLADFEMRERDYGGVIDPIEYPTGCFMFFRTAPLQSIGGFDPDFFLHYEDADIGRRMLQVARVVYVPSVRVIHRWARDTHRSWSARWITVRSGWIYFRKWGGVFSSPPAQNPPSSPSHTP